MTNSVLGQDAASGLGRIYIQPVNGTVEKLLGFEMIQEHFPALVVDSAKSADCVLGSTTVPGVDGRIDFVLVDRQTRSIAWEFSARSADLESSKGKRQEKVIAKMVHSLAHQGAFCGGAAFSAPSQNAAERVKAFKPPTFNW
jgi:hypothetical protein